MPEVLRVPVTLYSLDNEAGRAGWHQFTERQPATPDQLATAFAAMAGHAVGPGRARTLAPYALFLDAAADPALASLLSQGRAEVLGWGSAAG